MIILKIIAGAAAISVLLIVGNAGINKQERAECLQWQKQAEVYQDFYLTAWQAEQCQARGIIINAPVK